MSDDQNDRYQRQIERHEAYERQVQYEEEVRKKASELLHVSKKRANDCSILELVDMLEVRIEHQNTLMTRAMDVLAADLTDPLKYPLGCGTKEELLNGIRYQATMILTGKK